MDRASRTIPESLYDALVDLYGEVDPLTNRRRGYRELAAWLKTEHGIEVAHETVRRVVDPLRKERQEIRREVLREKFAASLPHQLETLDGLVAKLATRAQTGERPLTTAALANITNTVRRVVFGKADLVLSKEDEAVTLSGSPQGLAEFLSAAFDGASPNPSGPLEE